MTDKKKFKRRVRERMARTGESYQAALQAIQHDDEVKYQRARMTDEEVLEEYGLAVLGVDSIAPPEPRG